MKRSLLTLTTTTALALALTTPLAQARSPLTNDSVTILKAGSQASLAGSSETFTGQVRIDSLFNTADPARIGGGVVTFQPGARTAWHTHPLGQTLIVTQGVGRVQEEGGEILEIRPGDIVWIPPAIKHWHGASPYEGMTHLALAEALDGKTVTWLEQVTETQYQK